MEVIVVPGDPAAVASLCPHSHDLLLGHSVQTSALCYLRR